MSKMSNNGRRKSQNKKMSIHIMFNHVAAHRRETWKRWLSFIQVAIRFHPGRHRKPKTQTLIISSTGVKSFYIELNHYLRVFFPFNVRFPCQQRSLFPSIQQARGKEPSVSREMCIKGFKIIPNYRDIACLLMAVQRWWTFRFFTL